MLKAVIFDLGGTLMRFGEPDIDFQELTLIGLKDTYRYLEESAQYHLPEAEIFTQLLDAKLEAAWEYSQRTKRSQCLTTILPELLSEWERPGADLYIEDILRVFHLAQQPYVKLYEDTVETLETFRGRGLKIGLISNTVWTPEMHDDDLERLGILDAFDHRLYSSAFEYAKPHPAIFWASLGALGVQPEEAFFVGDRVIDDIGGAQGVGMRGILKVPPMREEHHDAIVPDACITTLRELWPLVLED
jgi:putative hydrolase of the HAD superfamily